MESIPFIRSRQPARLPFMVERRPTENWACHSAHATRAEAEDTARALRAQYPHLPVRVVQHPAHGATTQTEEA